MLNGAKMLTLSLALATAAGLAGCASQKPPPMDSTTADAARSADLSAGKPAAFVLPKLTEGYQVDIYPGLDDKFEIDPQLTPTEFNELGQLDAHCDKTVSKISGRLWQYVKTGGKYAIGEGLGTMLGALIGFGSHINPAAYLAYGALSGLGGGLANADEMYEESMRVAKGYCMTLMIDKADELEQKLTRVVIIPLVAGKGESPIPSDAAKNQFQDVDTSGAPHKPKLPL